LYELLIYVATCSELDVDASLSSWKTGKKGAKMRALRIDTTLPALPVFFTRMPPTLPGVRIVLLLPTARFLFTIPPLLFEDSYLGDGSL
jgi:hypothetical protein